MIILNDNSGKNDKLVYYQSVYRYIPFNDRLRAESGSAELYTWRIKAGYF